MGNGTTREIDDLKTKWKEMNKRLDRLEEATVKESIRISDQRVRSAQENLAASYKRIAIIAGIMGLVCCPTFVMSKGIFNYPDQRSRIISALTLGAYFLICMVMDGYLSSAVMDINLAKMPVTKVRDAAIRLKRLHHIFQIILIPAAITALAVSIYPLKSEPYILIGCGAGALLGAMIGWIKYKKMMRDYRELINS